MGITRLQSVDGSENASQESQGRNVEDTGPAGFEVLYEHHYRSVFNYVARTVMNRHAAEDITAEAFLRAYQHFESYRPNRAPFSTWIFAIATNYMRDYLRKNRGVALLEPDSRTLEQLLSCRGTSPDAPEQMAQLEAFGGLHRVIGQLKPNYRMAITLYYFEGRSLREIAQILGEMPATVRWRLYRARTLLARKLTHLRGEQP